MHVIEPLLVVSSKNKGPRIIVDVKLQQTVTFGEWSEIFWNITWVFPSPKCGSSRCSPFRRGGHGVHCSNESPMSKDAPISTLARNATGKFSRFCTCTATAYNVMY